MHMREFNQCVESISGQVLDCLDWIKYVQSKVYPETPSYSSLMLSRYVRQEINRLTDVPDLEEFD